jgi:UDP-2,3-diacylglucosamine pyrophosphatase LpxH
VVINDQHVPFQDKKINKLVFDFITDFKPDIIDILGDLVDFWQISSFDKDPKRKGSIQSDIDQTHEYLKELRDIAPQAEIEVHAGNHTDRLRKYIWRQAEELNSLRSMNLGFLLGLEELKISLLDKAEDYRRRGDLILTHGTMVSSDAGMTARRMLKRYGLSVMMGHTHRGGSTYVTDMLGTRGAWENFCLCNMNLATEWRMGMANWQTGFSYIYYYPDRFEVHQVPIIKGKFTVEGKEYGNGN